jgi:hypothetical protein
MLLCGDVHSCSWQEIAIAITVVSSTMFRQQGLQPCFVNKVDETCLINVVRTMLFTVVHSSGVNNIVRTGVNNIDERTICF